MGFISGIFASHAVSSEGHWLTRSLAPVTHAGTAVSEHNSMQLPAVYAAVGLIADCEAQLPFCSHQLSADGKSKTRTPGHPAEVLLDQQPNPWMPAFTMRQTLQSHAVTWGNGYANIQRKQNGEPIALWPLMPDRTEPVVVTDEEDGQIRLEYHTTIDGQLFRMDPMDVLHIRGMGFDGVKGYSPIWLARQAVGLGLALEEFGSRFFSNDSKSGGFIKHPGRLSKEAKENIQDSVESQGGLDQAHRVKVLEEGMDYQPVTIPPEDAQFLKTREFQVEEIARLYRVPLFMLQSHSKDTSWGTGISEQSLGFLRYTINPWLTRWEQEVNFKLYTPAERQQGFFAKHDVSSLLRPDAKGRADFYTKALNPQTGWMKRDEVRKSEDLNPLEGEWVKETPQNQPPMG